MNEAHERWYAWIQQQLEERMEAEERALNEERVTPSAKWDDMGCYFHG